MSAMADAEAASSGTNGSERSVLLLWMIFTGLSIFAVFLLWRYGLIHLMVVSDRTYISSLIAVLYVVTCGHCFCLPGRLRAKARSHDAAARSCRRLMASGASRRMRAPCQAVW